MQELAGWIAAIVALLAFFFNIRRDRKADGDAAMDARMKPIADKVDAMNLAQKAQSDAIASLGLEQVRLQTEMQAHDKEDERRFDSLEKVIARFDEKIDALPQKIKDLFSHEQR